ncbi:MAG: MFS transporter [Acidimicrobiales bacterium]
MTTTVAARLRDYGTYPLVALAATLAIEQGERLSLAQAFDGIKDEFGTSDTMLGGLAAAMVLVGVAGSLPIGSLTDRVHRGRLLAAAIVIWTVCMALGSVAPTFALLFATRLGVGAVEANSPAAFSLLSDFYPVSRRARVMGRYQAGAAVGGLVGIALSGVLVDAFGWRAALWMWIPFGVLTVLLLLRLPEPDRGAQDRDFHGELATNRGQIRPVSVAGSEGSALRQLLSIRTMWFGVLSLTLSSFLLQALSAWGIELFKRAHDLSAGEASVFAPAIGAGAAIGLLGGGTVADRLLRRGVVNARVFVAAFAAVAASVLLVPAVLTDSLALAAVLLFFGTLCLTTPIAPSEALLADVVPSAIRGRAAGMRAVVRSLAALAPWVVGRLSDATDLQTALAAVVPLYGVGGLVMLLAARSYPGDVAIAGGAVR